MRAKYVGNKGDKVFMICKNEDTVSIPVGSPVCLALNATDDGLAVILPSTTASLAHGGLFGVTTKTLAVNDYGEVQVFGFCQEIILLTGTRATSTDSFSTQSGAVGIALNVDTVNNVFSTSGGTQAKTAFLPWGILAQSFTQAGIASTTGTFTTVTAITQYVKAFLRIM